MINPVYGSVGLLCSGDWDKCQAAVDAVLTGSIDFEPNGPPSTVNHLSLKCCDIRHVCNSTNFAASGELLKVKTSRFKKPDHRTKPKPGPAHDLGSGSNVEANRQVERVERETNLISTNRRKPSRVLRNGSRFEKGDVELELSLKSAQ